MSKKSKRPVIEGDISPKQKKVSTCALTVNMTGIRDGEIIEGINANQTKGVVMSVKCEKVDYFPIDVASDELIRDQMKNVQFFSEMTFDERKAWINANVKSYVKGGTKENHLYDPHNEGLKVKFLKIEGCKHFSEKLGAETIELLLKGNPDDEEGYWPIRDVYDLFKPKDKVTKANRHNLILRPENWALQHIRTKQSIFNGSLVLRLASSDSAKVEIEHNVLKTNIAIQANEEILTFHTLATQEIAVIYESPNKNAQPHTRDLLFAIALKYLGIKEFMDCKEIVPLIEHFTPSVYKSLIQKIIRTQCSVVVHDGKQYFATSFLLTALILLSLHPGTFNPQKQRFVSGLESATKRLAVIVCEDSYVEDMSHISLLLVDALIKQHDRSWMPPLAHFGLFFQIALEALASNRLLLYKTDKEYKVPTLAPHDKKALVPYKLNYVLMKQIGGMTGDINFFSHLTLGPFFAPEVNKKKVTYSMSLSHCIDQHCYTSIAHFLPYDKDVVENSTAPYRALFSRLWTEVGSVNGRKDRERMLKMEEEPFVKQVRLAQSFIFKQKYVKNEPPPLRATGNYDFKYKIDASWLAGLIGVIEVKLPKGPNVIVVMRTDDITEMVVIRNPKNERAPKDKAASELSQEEKEAAIELARDRLREGYPLKHVPGILSSLFKGAQAWLLDDGTYTLEYANGERADWLEEATSLCYCLDEISFPSYASWEEGALSMRGVDCCVATECDERFEKVLNEYSVDVLKRLYMYLAHYRPSVKLYDIARDGSASKLDVSLKDSAVHHILCAICTLYPACLELGTTTFVVKNGPLLWSLKDVIKEKIDEEPVCMQEDTDEYWPEIKGDTKTPLFSHQQDSVDEMFAKVERGKRAHGVFIDVGLGKTMICMSFIKRLVEEKKMPAYCVYSAPPSAITNALSEFERFGIPYHIVVQKKEGAAGYRDTPFERFKINVLCHDHMRRAAIYTSLKAYAGQTLFILDEFHLASSSTTIRSSIALEIARLSWDFVAMTGTIVRNSNTADLICWLELIVDFYVYSDNYLVAFSALVSRRYDTGVVVKYVSVMAPFTPKEEKAYYATVTPKLGGTASKFNFQGSLDVCYSAVDKEIVRQVKHYVVEKKEVVFVLAKSIRHQEKLRDMILQESTIKEREIFLIDKHRSIVLKPETKTPIRVVITTLLNVTGYTLTKCKTCITSIYPSSESTRHQFEGRLDRIGQPSKEIAVVSIHCGLLTYLSTKYTRVRNFAKILHEFADEVEGDYASVAQEMCK